MKYNYFFTVKWEIDGYCAYIPAFNATVVDDNLDDLIEGVEFSIETGIDICKEEGRPIPVEDGDIQTSGKVALRLPRSLHKKMLVQSKYEGVSMNQYIVSKLAAA
jgi:antitoxin HicB